MPLAYLLSGRAAGAEQNNCNGMFGARPDAVTVITVTELL